MTGRGPAGHRFPGGTRAVEHWENALLTEATGADPMPAGLVHPIHLFHVPIEGAGVSIGELFELADAEGPDRVGLQSYDWEYIEPLREDVDYRCDGEVVSFERRTEGCSEWDELVFTVELQTEDRLAARVTNTWQIWRST
ncbi:MAG: hypothetical protein P8J50_09230 [Acidimicrobiales bacterium]|jgi:hypothetical protein|nr:hypothetical protein [Acidimicrobiales bacterium]